MTAGVKAEALRRITATRDFIRAIESHGAAALHADPASRAARGLVFVQNYAVYEYVITQCVREMIAAANTLTIPLRDLRTELLALALNGEFDAISKGAIHKTWAHRCALMRSFHSANPAQIRDGLFPKDGSQFRKQQLDTIWDIFGITEPVLPHPRFQSFIDEMVENRNKVAHGSDAPEDVGRRYSIADILSRINDNETLCTYLTSVIVNHIDTASAFRRGA